MWLKLPSFKYIKIDSGALKQVQMIKKKSLLVLKDPPINQDQTHGLARSSFKHPGVGLSITVAVLLWEKHTKFSDCCQVDYDSSNNFNPPANPRMLQQAIETKWCTATSFHS